MRYKVRIDDSVILCMLLNGLESFLLAKQTNLKKPTNQKKMKGLEIDGYIFGRRKIKKKLDEVEFKVEYLNINTTSFSSQKELIMENHAEDLKKAICESIFPGIKILGSFHTHPYRLEEGIASGFFSGMYEPSDADELCPGENYQLDLILAIVNGQTKLRQGLRYANSCEYCIQFDIENIRFFIGAYVREGEDAKYAPFCNVSIEMPELLKSLPDSFELGDLNQLFKI